MFWERWLHILPLRIRTLFSRKAVEQELDEELRDHVEHQVTHFVSRGMSPARARTEALKALGGVERRKEECRDARGMNGLDHLIRDTRLGIRALLRNPGYTTVALITLALGIGATTAIFTVVNSVLLRPLEYRIPSRLVVLKYREVTTIAGANFLDFRSQSHSFESMGAAEWWTPNVSDGVRPDELDGLRITADILPMLGVVPLLGRVFTPEETHQGSNHVLVLSYEIWQRRFGGDSGVVGQSLRMDGEPYQIIGVMPRGFRFAPFWATSARLWAPLVLDNRLTDRTGASLRVFARLKPGVTVETASREMAAITARLNQEYPGTNPEAMAVPLMDMVVGDVRDALLVLFAAVGFVLLIACANVAHLQLLRAASREREFALRGALGASRSRLIQQSLAESGILAMAGGAAGLLVAWGGVRLLVRLAPKDIPRLDTLGIDAPVLLFVLAISLSATILFGLVPAISAARVNLHQPLKEGSRGSADTPHRRRIRGLLVASEFALALMLLVGAGLVLRSFAARRGLDAGFKADGVFSAIVALRGTAHADRDRRAGFFEQVVDQVGALPGVIEASAINHLPLHGDNWQFPFFIEGRPFVEPGQGPRAYFRVTRPGYFSTMSIPILSGRDFTRDDLTARSHLVVINQSMADQQWPGESPLGKRLTVDNPAATPDWFTVVGVVKDARQAGWTEEVRGEMYFPNLAGQGPAELAGSQGSFVTFLNPVDLTLVVRTQGPPEALLKSVQGVVNSIDRDAPVTDVLTMKQAVDEQFAEPRFYLSLLAGFAILAVTLAAIGIYGVMSYSVARRSQEIGIRLALGAGTREAFNLIVGQGMRLAALGGMAGIAGALMLSRYLRSLLFGIGPADPLTFLVVVILLSLVALAAAAIPARRAARVNPLSALRSD